MKTRTSRLERQALHGGFSWSKLLVAAAVFIAVCIIFLNSNRILNVDLHGGFRTSPLKRSLRPSSLLVFCALPTPFQEMQIHPAAPAAANQPR